MSAPPELRAYWSPRPPRASALTQAPEPVLKVARTFSAATESDFRPEGAVASDQSIRIEASSRPHAESLQATLDGYSSQLVREGKSWQVELEGDDLSTQLLELLRVLGSWLETEQLESLRVIFDDRTYTLLVPSDSRQDDSPALLLERIAQLETALRSRIVIEQAKGILAARLGLEPEECFQILRHEARSRRTNLHELAEQVVRSRSVPWQT